MVMEMEMDGLQAKPACTAFFLFGDALVVCSMSNPTEHM
jgi:hypothetical protein